MQYKTIIRFTLWSIISEYVALKNINTSILKMDYFILRNKYISSQRVLSSTLSLLLKSFAHHKGKQKALT